MFLASCPGWGWSPPGTGIVLWEDMLPARKVFSLLLPQSSQLSIPFMLSHLPLALFFFSWIFLPLDYPLSLKYLSVHFILRAQPRLFQSPADP